MTTPTTITMPDRKLYFTDIILIHKRPINPDSNKPNPTIDSLMFMYLSFFPSNISEYEDDERNVKPFRKPNSTAPAK